MKPTSHTMTVSRVAEVLEVVCDRLGCIKHLPYLLALFRVAAGRIEFETTDTDLGQYLPGDPTAAGESKAQRAYRARKAFRDWQNQSEYRLVTWLKGGGQDDNGDHPLTRYTVHVLALCGDILAELPAGGRGPWRAERIREGVEPQIERLKSTEPTSRLRAGVRYPQGGAPRPDAESEVKRGVKALRKGAELAPDPCAYWRRVWDEIGAELIASGVLAPDPDLEPDPPEDVDSQHTEEGNTGGGDSVTHPALQIVGRGASEDGHLHDTKSPIGVDNGGAVREASLFLGALASVGVEGGQVVLKDDETRRGRSPHGHQALEAIAEELPEILEAAELRRESVILRVDQAPHVVQVDDCGPEVRARLEPLSFLVIETSPGNAQCWLALDGAADPAAVRRRLLGALAGTGANAGANGAVRVPGSRNHKYSPAPMVRVGARALGRHVTPSELEGAGVLAPELRPEPPPPLCSLFGFGSPAWLAELPAGARQGSPDQRRRG